MENPKFVGTLSGNTGDVFIESLVVGRVTAFTAVSGVLMLGSSDKTSTYCSGSAGFTASTNVLTTHTIGGQASIQPGTYQYFLSGTYDGGKVTTWYWLVVITPKYGPGE